MTSKSRMALLARTSSVDWSRYPTSTDRRPDPDIAELKGHDKGDNGPLSRTDIRRLTRANSGPEVDVPNRAVGDGGQAGQAPLTPAEQYKKQIARKTRNTGLYHYSRRNVLNLPDHPAAVVSLQEDRGKGKGDSSVSISCPNLVEDDCPNVVVKTKVRITRSSEGYLDGSRYRSGSSSAGSERPSPKLLTVPDIFVTSLTHSSGVQPEIKGNESQGPNGEEASPSEELRRRNGGYRHSAPELAGTASEGPWQRLRQNRNQLKKSLSDIQPRLTRSRTTDDDYTADSCEPRVSQVVDYLYIGNLESAYNERLMCKLHIRSVVDLSNVLPENVPPGKKCNAPCACGREERHLRATLRIGLNQSDVADIKSSFEQVNKFIEGARKAQKNVLVLCWSGNSTSAVGVIQYLMAHRGLNLRKAYSMVMRQRSDLDLSPGYQAWLQTLEKRLLPTNEQSLCLDRDADRDEGKCLPKEAWIATDSDI